MIQSALEERTRKDSSKSPIDQIKERYGRLELEMRARIEANDISSSNYQASIDWKKKLDDIKRRAAMDGSLKSTVGAKTT
jgi:hypothetical protein